MKTKTRVTKQKKIILEILSGTTTHPTADWIYEQARKFLPDISLGTVYRNLRVLTETGEIQELNYGSTYSRYDGNAANHYHFVCTECQRVFDVPLPLKNQMNSLVAEQTGFKVDFHRTEFYGTCQDCLKKRQSIN